MFGQQPSIDSIINVGGCAMDAEMPQFIGGNDSLKKFISRNFNLSVDKSCTEGKIFLKFAIEEDGSLKNIKVTRGLSYEMDKEAIRILQTMPNWKPATHNGKPVRMIIHLPLKVG
ncbi:MAG: hypothetical protein C0448_10080 [Sphingobacteriaceae bacterium]|nr:hypothetical protein [Sphingobacteriaceae bacterium]